MYYKMLVQIGNDVKERGRGPF